MVWDAVEGFWQNYFLQNGVSKAKRTESQEFPASTSTTAEEGFFNDQPSWSLRKAAKALPKNPRKQKAVVTSLAKKFNVRIASQPSKTQVKTI